MQERDPSVDQLRPRPGEGSLLSWVPTAEAGPHHRCSDSTLAFPATVLGTVVVSTDELPRSHSAQAGSRIRPRSQRFQDVLRLRHWPPQTAFLKGTSPIQPIHIFSKGCSFRATGSELTHSEVTVIYAGPRPPGPWLSSDTENRWVL